MRISDWSSDVCSSDLGKMLLASPPENIAGKIEVRGIGLVEMTHISDVPVALVVQLFDVVDRMPPTPELRVMAGISIPVMKIAPKESSAPIKEIGRAHV